jgi:hypothetical protein
MDGVGEKDEQGTSYADHSGRWRGGKAEAKHIAHGWLIKLYFIHATTL